MSSRFRRMPSYHYVDNTDGNILNPAANVLRDYTISGNHGKNLIPYPFPYHSIYGVKNGITVTDSGNSSITLNGTATASVVVYLAVASSYKLPAGKYYLSGNSSNVSTLALSAGANATDGSTLLYASDHGEGIVLDISEIAKQENYQGVTIAIRISKGTVLENVVLKPRLEIAEVGNVTNIYLDAPVYANQLLNYKKDDLPEFKTLETDDMNIYVDTSVSPSNIKIEYFQDINTVLSDMKNAILSQGGNL